MASIEHKEFSLVTVQHQLVCHPVGKRRYVFYWGGGWGGASEGRVLSKFFTNWGGSNLFYSKPGEGHSFFGKEKKITPCRF